MTPHTSSHNGQVRLRDVAERAGVSAGTVSNTLNHPDRVHARTQALVKEAIEALGYVPNQQARMLTGAASKVMGLVVLGVESPFYMETAQAIERSFRESGHFLMLCNSESDLDREAELLRMLAAQRVRGVLLAPATPDADPHRYLDIAPDLSVVLLDFDGGDTHCSVAVDNVAGGRLAARYLLQSGHRKLAFIGGPAQIRQFTERASGARAELIDAGLDPEVHLVEIAASGIGIQDGHAAAEELLAVAPPDGVLCGNDMLAFGAYRAMTAAGLRIPQDVSIVGYDDINVAKDWIVPMTTVRQPIDELGRIAARLILEDSSGDAGHVHRHVRLRPELIIRRSTAPR